MISAWNWYAQDIYAERVYKHIDFLGAAAMNSQQISSLVDRFAKKDVHSIYLTADSDKIENTKVNVDNSYFYAVKVNSSSGLKDQKIKKDIYTYAANVMIFNLIFDFDLANQEIEECRKMVHHLKNLGFARILNCSSKNSQILKNLCQTYNVYYEETF